MLKYGVPSFLQPALLIAAVLLVPACSSTNAPAPVVTRTTPGAPTATRPAQPPAPVARSTPAPSQAPSGTAPGTDAAPWPGVPNEAGVQTAPIRQAGVESRPLGSAGASARNKTGPRGTKLPYSEQNIEQLRLAELGTSAAPTPSAAVGSQAPSAPVAPASPSVPPQPATAPSQPPAASEKAVEFAWPASGKVTQGFSEPRSLGLSLDGKTGDPVNAAADGKVIFSGPGPRGYGNLVIVKHDGDYVSVYAHNKALLVKEGQPVKKGQRIAELGDSGTDRPKLHFEIRKQGKPVDPAKLLPKRG
jgi:lipoprotein NlpD